MNSSLEAVVEFTEASATRKHHGLDDGILALANVRLIYFTSFCHRSGHSTVGDGDLEASHHVHRDLFGFGEKKRLAELRTNHSTTDQTYILVDIEKSCGANYGSGQLRMVGATESKIGSGFGEAKI